MVQRGNAAEADLLNEAFEWAPDSGENMTVGTWDYKPQSVYDIPEHFNCTLLPDSPNPEGFMSSKASGEPPLLLSAAILMATRDAVAAARAEAGVSSDFRLDAPATPLAVQAACAVDPASQFTLG